MIRQHSWLLPAVVASFLLLSVDPVLAAREHKPRRNVRVGLGLGQGLVLPAIACSRCDSFWGRSFSFALEVGGTIRPDITLSFDQQFSVIYFADGTTAGLSAYQLLVRYFRTERSFLMGGVGVGVRSVSEDQAPRFGVREWMHVGPLITAGAGYELIRAGSWSFDAQARVTSVVDAAVVSGVLLLLGLSWN
jgi:hypothetical protein